MTSTLITAAVSLSAALGSKSVHTEIVIPSPPEQVWQVLVDIENYDKWNPAITVVEGELAVGNAITYRFQETADKAANISSEVVLIEPNQHLNHKGGLWGIITFDQHYRLVPHEAGTLFTIDEDYTGIYVNFWDHTHTQKQYDKMAEALKQWVLELQNNESDYSH